MFFRIQNLTNNPLQMSDGRMLPPFGADKAIVKVAEIGKREKDYEKRGWVATFEEKEDVPTEVPPVVEPPIIPASAVESLTNSKAENLAGGRRK